MADNRSIKGKVLQQPCAVCAPSRIVSRAPASTRKYPLHSADLQHCHLTHTCRRSSHCRHINLVHGLPWTTREGPCRKPATTKTMSKSPTTLPPLFTLHNHDPEVESSRNRHRIVGRGWGVVLSTGRRGHVAAAPVRRGEAYSDDHPSMATIPSSQSLPGPKICCAHTANQYPR
jgi:hypothetical protein